MTGDERRVVLWRQMPSVTARAAVFSLAERKALMGERDSLALGRLRCRGDKLEAE